MTHGYHLPSGANAEDQIPTATSIDGLSLNIFKPREASWDTRPTVGTQPDWDLGLDTHWPLSDHHSVFTQDRRAPGPMARLRESPRDRIRGPVVTST